MAACLLCGADERNKQGKCLPCARRRNKDWHAVNKERHAARKREERKRIDSPHRALITARKLAKLRRMPSWLSYAQRKEINDIYIQARTLTRDTGVKHVVDHILPLQGKTISGLHVPWNLRVVTFDINAAKLNALIEDLL